MLFAHIISQNKELSTIQHKTELNNNNDCLRSKKVQIDSHFCEGELDNEGEYELLGEQNGEEEDGLMDSERELYENVISEFDGLRQAVNTYILVDIVYHKFSYKFLQKMKQFATELEQSQSVSILDAPSCNPKPISFEVSPTTSKIPVVPSISVVKDRKRPVAAKIMLKQQKCKDNRPSTSTSLSPSPKDLAHNNRPNARPQSSPASGVELDGWHIRLKELEV